MADKSKSFTEKEIGVLVVGLNLAEASFARRIAAEKDVDAKAVWEAKLKEIKAVGVKVVS